MKNFLAKKPIQPLIDQAKSKSFSRSLSALDLSMMGVGAIIGAGLFVLTGQAAASYAGPGIIISFVLAALICIFSAFCYSELVTTIPVSGGAYTYAYLTIGEFFAWLVGWSLTLEFLLSAATVAGGWSAYLSSLFADFGIQIPEYLSTSPLQYAAGKGWFLSGSLINLPSLVIFTLIGFLVAKGIKTAASVNNFLVILKALVLIVFVAFGISHIDFANYSPMIPENAGVFGQFGWSGIFRAAGIVFFSYIGFDAIATLAQEAKNPQRDLSIGMLSSLSISSIVYVVVGLVLVGIVHYSQLGVSDPMAVAFNALGQSMFWLRPIVKLAIMAGLTSVILVMLAGQARIFFMMAKDGLLPRVFSQVHSKHQTPYYTTLILTGFGGLVTAFFPVDILGQLVSMGTLLGFGVVCFGVIILRIKEPGLSRPFKAPLYPWIPILGTLSCLLQMALLPGIIWVQLLVWIGLGSGVYFLYGKNHSKLKKPETTLGSEVT